MSQEAVTAPVPPDFSTLPPVARLMQLTDGMRMMQGLYVVAKLGIADHLADGARSAGELAAATGTHAASLYRVLRAVANGGVFSELPDGRFALNEEAECLRSDTPASPRSLFVMFGEIGWRAYGGLLHSVRTGGTAFDHVFGAPAWPYMEDHPEDGAVFDDAMTHLSTWVSRFYVMQLEFEPGWKIADLGGGHGYLLAELLRANPGCTGVLFDRRPVVAQAAPTLHERGVTDRVTVLGGDFLVDEPPAGCDVYLFKSVLHCLSDEEAIAVLRWARPAVAAAGAEVLILDRVVAPAGTWDVAKFLDLDMLALFGGRDRTLPQWQELIAAAGFSLVNDPDHGQWAILACRPA
jgi:O-methyltransferase domain